MEQIRGMRHETRGIFHFLFFTFYFFTLTSSASPVTYYPQLTSKVPAVLLLAAEDPTTFKDGVSGPSGCMWPVSSITRRGYAAAAVDVTKDDVKAAVDALVADPRIDAAKIAVIGQREWGEQAARTAAADPRLVYAFCNNPTRRRPQRGDRRTADIWETETAFDFSHCGAHCVLGFEMAGRCAYEFDAKPARFLRFGGTQLTGDDWQAFLDFLDRKGWRPDLVKNRAPRTFRVMAWNLEGESEGPLEVESCAQVIRDSEADVVLVVENYGMLPKLLAKLGGGWQGEYFSMSLAVLTRQRLIASERPYRAPWNYLAGDEPFNFGLVEIEVDGQRVRCCPIWLNWESGLGSFPWEKGADAVIKHALAKPRFSNRRIDEINGILGAIASHLAETDEIPLVIGGDFNSDGDLEWTEATKDFSGHHGLVVPWPESLEMRKKGFTDTFRAVRPDPAKDYGRSWVPKTRWKKDGTTDECPQRIDYIYSKGAKLKTVDSEIFIAAWHRPFVWHGRSYASFPSDHGFVLTTFELTTPAPVPPVVVSEGGCDVQRSIGYKPNEKACLVDLSIPKGVKDFPTVVWYHGGGLTYGQRHFIDIDTSRVAIAAVEYRLMKTDAKGAVIANGPISPAMVLDDCAAAAAWVKRHIAERGGNPNRIFISGHSAGGYITHLLGLDAKWLKAYGLTPFDFAGYLPLSGQATKHFAVRQYFGQGENQMRPIVDEWAPIFHIAKKTPPFCIMLGDRRIEWRMREEESEFMYGSMKALGNGNVEFHSYPNTNHGSCYKPAMSQIMKFIGDHK